MYVHTYTKLLPGATLRRGSVLGSGSIAAEDMDIPIGAVFVGSKGGQPVMAVSRLMYCHVLY